MSASNGKITDGPCPKPEVHKDKGAFRNCLRFSKSLKYLFEITVDVSLFLLLCLRLTKLKMKMS